jgi:site-specific recombinase XerD
MTLKDWQLRFEQHNQHLRLKVWRMYSQRIERLVKHFGPDKDPGDVFRADVERYRDYRFKRGMSGMTIRTEVACGKTFYNFIAREGGVEMWFNPFRGVRTVMKKAEPERLGLKETFEEDVMVDP